MKTWLAMLLLVLASGLTAAAEDAGGKSDAASGAGAETPAAATPAPLPPHRLMWDVQIGVAPPQSKALVVLLPDASGKQTALVVTAAQGEVVLDKPYAAADVGGKGNIEVGELSADEVRKRFGATLAAQPLRPVSWLLFFASGGMQLTAESKALLAKLKTELKAELARRDAGEILVIGHADQAGKPETNDALSLKRARFVAAALAAIGVDKRQIEVSGRGTREPRSLAPGRAEPKNRRVEIVVR